MDARNGPPWRDSVPRRKPVPLQSKPEIESTYKQLPVSADQDGHIFRRSSNLLNVTTDAILCLTPLSFVILAALALNLDGKPLSPLGHNVQAWALLSPTIFPLVFAAVVGRALNFFARLGLERGSSLGVLEQLVGSQTVFGTIWVQVVLRNFNALGVFLILLWLISPLGGQASLRLISQDREVDVGSTTLACVDPTNTTSSSFQGFAQIMEAASINALYTGCMVAPLPIKISAQDTWGNIKVPRFETYNHTLDDEGNAKIPEEDVDWAHCLATSDWIEDVLGVSLANQTNASAIWDGGVILDGGVTPSSWRLHLSDDPLQAYDPDKLSFVWFSKCGRIDSFQDPPTDLNYDSTCLANCSMTVTHAEVHIACHGLSCKPTKIREIPPPSDWVGSLVEHVGHAMWAYFYQNLVGFDTRGASVTSSVTEHYICGHVESPFQYGASTAYSDPGYLDMTEVPLPDFTRRLRTILNTYFIASVAPDASTGTMSNANATRLLNGENRIPGGYYGLGLMPATATTSSSRNVYRCNKTFVTLTIIASAILYIIGVAGVIAKYWCKGPDMLGYITSIVRHNPYTALHVQNSTLDTSELARQSKEMFLRLEDVKGMTDNVGHVAISSLRKTSVRRARMQRPNRKYK
ncbi:MAG: hypothetical protein Q9213_006088 [Squamulea squamosa]